MPTDTIENCVDRLKAIQGDPETPNKGNIFIFHGDIFRWMFQREYRRMRTWDDVHTYLDKRPGLGAKILKTYGACRHCGKQNWHGYPWTCDLCSLEGMS